MIYGKIINAVKNYNKTIAALDPFGGRNTPQENRKNAASRAAMMKDIQARNEQSNNMSAKSRGGGGSKGPTVADQVAARAAAKLKAKKAKGQARRKKYEAAGSMAKKMKLIFVD